MQHPGIPAKTHPDGCAARHADTAVHRTFQIKAFSTELKNHVMVMDFVKKNWFPSQRRAKVCIVHMYQGLKAAERTASRYEGTLASPRPTMIPSTAIAQLMDEGKSREDGAALPVLCADPQLPAWPVKQALASRSGVTIDRAFAFLPGQLGVQTPAGSRGREAELPPKEEKPGSGPRKGFASITITARRVGPPAGSLVWGAVGDPLCTRCRVQHPLLRDPSVLASGAHPGRHRGPFTCTESSRSGSVMRLRFPEAQLQLCDGHQYWVTSVDHREGRFPPDPPPSGKGPLLFSSCVHLRVSQQCPNAIYYLDRPLSVPMEQTRLAGPKMHRSVLSLNLRCSSHGLTPEGAGGTAKAGPISSALKPQLPEGGPGLLGPRWTPVGPPALGQVHLGTGTCPWGGSSPLDDAEFAAAGAQQIAVRKGAEAPATCCHAGVHTDQLSIHIPGWSYRAGDYTCCDLVVKLKECQRSEASATPAPAPEPRPEPVPTPVPHRPAPSAEPEAPDPQEDLSECQPPLAAASLTLQEALEVRKPQFISRSQERLRRLERMIQQRRAQRKDGPGPRQGPLPVRASKKQFTVPHPLSDNLFKPKERYISEKEMHMRSKRIYNNLPEVKKKKEEQKKRLILQSNRLRAEVFKKQLLDQLLQRNAV
ncbi:(E2-independent) E3 ubiquitin-conjugating enzyme FATS isoform X1 [Phyllostomus hastatus]|uniref:(E2-independent) E3 ubiquitin-conjugating enzyme FATS isoform X1 n=1 Tax=Phyllostomus hastatus TaxID=9423 RepID=UPI001E685ACE|nr:(E2-independent) E3 ubiquitin-conjugating enzyme FATS isoform X1 [Phyllostomus hastatus]